MSPELKLKALDQKLIDVEPKEPTEIEYVAPLENRIAYLSLIDEPTQEWLTAKAIANQIGTTHKWVQSTAERIGISSELDPNAVNDLVEIYPPLSRELIKEELDWHRSYLGLDHQITANAIADFIGRGREYTVRKLSELDVKHKIIDGKQIITYPRAVVKTLREMELSIPPDNGWYTLNALAEHTGQHKEWIQKQLKNLGIVGQQRKSVVSGITRQHYPEDTIQIINDLVLERPQPAGDWLSIGAIAEKLRKSDYWVQARIESRYKKSGEIRQDDCGRSNITHYPPYVFEELLQELVSINEVQQPDGRLNVFNLSKTFDRSAEWVKVRLDILQAKPTPCLDKRGIVTDYYDPAVIEQIKSLPDRIYTLKKEYPDGYMTVSAMAEKMGYSEKWIRNRLDLIHTEPEKRTDSIGIVRDFFPPETIDKLLELPKKIFYEKRKDSDGYMTVNSIAEKVGHSSEWVKNRLKYVESQPELRLDLANTMRLHYPPLIVEQLLSLPEDLFSRKKAILGSTALKMVN